MKSLRLILALAVVGFVAAVAQADEAKKEAPASKTAKCCARAAEAGEKCGHGCCGEAAKEGNNCEKCKGSGKIEKKEEAKK